MRLNSKDLKVQKIKRAFLLIPRQQCFKSGSNLDMDLGTIKHNWTGSVNHHFHSS